jgi:hypothetical protein
MLVKQLPTTLMIVVGVPLMCMAAPRYARAGQDGWSVDVGVGPSPTVGDISSRLTNGWNINARAGYQFNDAFGLYGAIAYNGLGVTNQVLNALQVPDGNAHLWSLTAEPMWRFPIAHKVEGYVVGGAGWYRRTVEFTRPTINVVDVIDPWWGYIGPVIVPADQVLGSVTKDAFGANAGGGVALQLGESGTAVFAEVRYHYANTKPTSTSIVPVTVGLRWSGGRTSRPRP